MGCHRKFLSTFTPITWWGWSPKLAFGKSLKTRGEGLLKLLN